MSRASLVFHELAENYERTNNNIDYNGLSGAHKLAIEREKGWLLRGSLNPEEGGLMEGGKPPTPNRKLEIRKLIAEYLSTK